MTNIIKMENFEILRELPKCDTETWSEGANAVGKVAPRDLFDVGLPQTFNLLKKNTVSAKRTKVKNNKVKKKKKDAYYES